MYDLQWTWVIWLSWQHVLWSSAFARHISTWSNSRCRLSSEQEVLWRHYLSWSERNVKMRYSTGIKGLVFYVEDIVTSKWDLKEQVLEFNNPWCMRLDGSQHLLKPSWKKSMRQIFNKHDTIKQGRHHPKWIGMAKLSHPLFEMPALLYCSSELEMLLWKFNRL